MGSLMWNANPLLLQGIQQMGKLGDGSSLLIVWCNGGGVGGIYGECLSLYHFDVGAVGFPDV